MSGLTFRLCKVDNRVHEWPEDQRTDEEWTARCNYVSPADQVLEIMLGIPCMDCFVNGGTELADSGGDALWRSP